MKKSLFVLVMFSWICAQNNIFDGKKTGFVLEKYPWCDELYVVLHSKKVIKRETFHVVISFGSELVAKKNVAIRHKEARICKEKILLNNEGKEIFPGFYTVEIHALKTQKLLFKREQFLGDDSKSAVFIKKLIHAYLEAAKSLRNISAEVNRKIQSNLVPHGKEKIYDLKEDLTLHKKIFYFVPMTETCRNLKHTSKYLMNTINKCHSQIKQTHQQQNTDVADNYKFKIAINELLAKKIKETFLEDLHNLQQMCEKYQGKSRNQLTNVVVETINDIQKYPWSFD